MMIATIVQVFFQYEGGKQLDDFLYTPKISLGILTTGFDKRTYKQFLKETWPLSLFFFTTKFSYIKLI